MANYVINGKEMSERKFQIWTGRMVNLGMVRTLNKRGYTPEKISEITGLDGKLVNHYCNTTIDEL